MHRTIFSILIFAALAMAGIADRYSRDIGIANDPAVIFAENFESSSLDAIRSHMSSVEGYPDAFALSTDIASASGGQRSLRITNANTGGHVYRRFSNSDTVYMRFYMKLTGGLYSHTGGILGGRNPPSSDYIGASGIRPTGHERIYCGLEVYNDTPPLRLDFYTYWMEMRSWNGTAQCYGNSFVNNPAVYAVQNTWTCVEVMTIMNNPVDASNGQLRLWIDGRDIIHLYEGNPVGSWGGDMFRPGRGTTQMPFEGFRWRATDSLSINFAFLANYVTAGTNEGEVLYDDWVIARRYIGPINTGTGVRRYGLAPTNTVHDNANAWTITGRRVALPLHRMARGVYLITRPSAQSHVFATGSRLPDMPEAP